MCVQTCSDSAKQFVVTVLLTYQELCVKNGELKSTNKTLKIRPFLSVKKRKKRSVVFYVYLDFHFKCCDEFWIVTKIVKNFDIFP